MAGVNVSAPSAHASMGQAGDCSRALGAAQDAFARAGKDTDPAWCGFFDEGELYGLLSVTLRDLALADSDNARRYAADARQRIEQAIRQRPRNFLRSRVMHIDGLAVVNLLLGEPEAAGQAAATAMTMATAITSARVMSRLRISAIQWVPLADVPGLVAKQDITSASTMAALLLLLADDGRAAADTAADGSRPRP